MESEAISAAIKFIEALPDEVTWVVVKNNDTETQTIGREFVLSALKSAQKENKNV